MGQFSWYTCDTRKRILCNRKKEIYVLIPAEYGGGHIKEMCYDGYGHFGGKDIWELVAEWNQRYLIVEYLKKPTREWYDQSMDKTLIEEYFQKSMERYKDKCQRLLDYKNGVSNSDMSQKYGKEWKREIGIDIACGNSQNRKIKYPIKIAEAFDAVYETCKYSKRDPKHGWQ